MASDNSCYRFARVGQMDVCMLALWDVNIQHEGVALKMPVGLHVAHVSLTPGKVSYRMGCYSDVVALAPDA